MKTNTLVARNLGVITLFGFIDRISGTSKCQLQTKEEETITFPSMKRGSHSYGHRMLHGMIMEWLHVAGGYGGEKQWKGSSWALTLNGQRLELLFSDYGCCLAATKITTTHAKPQISAISWNIMEVDFHWKVQYSNNHFIYGT